MDKKEIVKEKIKKLEQDIIKDVLDGCYNDFSLHEKKCWIDALTWIIEKVL